MIVLCFCCFTLLISAATGQSIGDVRLVGGSTDWEGRVEVLYDIDYLDGGIAVLSWGTVCDDFWGSADAQVVCRQLGHHTTGSTAYWWAYFGQGSGTIYLDDVACTGSEARLIDCSYDSHTSDCSHYEDAGVRCVPYTDIRLVGGSVDWEGRVEVYISGQWGTVCHDFWSSNDAQVVCRQLGYSTFGATAYSYAHFGQGSGAILMDNVGCYGSETTLAHCSHTTNHNCGHYEDAGVACQPFTCQDGDVRLVGEGGFSGRVEVCLSQRWGTVCDDGWSISDAEVVCKQLGFFVTGLSHYVSAHFGEGTGPVLLSDVACTGLEPGLTDCSYSDTNSCTHSQDAGVGCIFDGTYSEGDIRLVGGSSHWEGRVEIYIADTWGTVDDDPWTAPNAQVVCRQLGYLSQGAIPYCCAYYGSGTGPIHIDDVSCSGSESRLIDCYYSTYTAEDSHIEDVGVWCQPDSCQNGDIQLVGGETEREGRLQLCLNQRWGTVCDHQWTVADANVVCAHLGYHPIGSLNYSVNETSEEISGPIFLDNVNCSGSEQKLIDCNFDYLANRCNHTQDVAVLCQPAQCTREIRLVDGDTEREGRLEVCVNERWGTVCDNGWSPTDSQVVCQQLGYSTSGSVSAHFSPGILPVLMTSVNCDGPESRLVNCSYSKDTDNCTHSNDVGVRCQPASCRDGNIQLVDEESEWEGRLEVCFNQRWGTVGGETWDSTETEVVCRELGYQSSGPAAGTGPIFMSNVSCSGSESRLLDCSYSISLSSSHSNDIGVRCSPVSCSDGDIQLVGGETEREGRVEVCLDQRWGTVNADGWSAADSQVVCRQLGYFSTSSAIVSMTVSDGTGPILMDNVGCYGWETRLIDCSHNRDTSEDTHDRDIAVHCIPDLPPPPRNISIETLSSTSLRVQWPLLALVTAEYGTILQYSLVCSAQNLMGHHHIVGKNTTQFVVTTLSPHTTYNCCVRAENVAGYGLPICGEGNTFEDVPASAPVELSSSPLDSRTLLLSWSPPLVGDRNGVIRMYYVNLTEQETGKEFHFETELPTLNVTSLHPSYHYSWTIAAYTVGIGPYSSALAVQMPEDIPSGSPSILSALRTSATAMEIVYTHVLMQESNGAITAYLITYYVNNRVRGCQSPATVRDVAVPANATLAVIQGLDPTQEYCVAVAARTSVGLGRSSQLMTVGLFSSVIIQVQLLEGPLCTWSLVTYESAPVTAAVEESILMAVNSGCGSQCSLAANHIRDSRLICCSENRDEIAFQATFYNMHIGSAELKSELQNWVDSQPHIRGWNTILVVSTTWQFDLPHDVFLDSEATCGEQQSSSSNLSDNSSDDSTPIAVPTVVLSAVLGVVIVVIAVWAVISCYKKKNKRATFVDSVQLQQMSHIQPMDTAQATPSPATPTKESSIAKPIGTKQEVGIQKKYNPYLYEPPSAMPTATKTTSPVVYANVPTGVEEYMYMDSVHNSPPPLPHKKQGTPIIEEEEIYDSIQ